MYFILYDMSVDPVERLNIGPLNLYFERPLVLWSQCKCGQKLHTTSLFAGRSCEHIYWQGSAGKFGCVHNHVSIHGLTAVCVPSAVRSRWVLAKRQKQRVCETDRTYSESERECVHSWPYPAGCGLRKASVRATCVGGVSQTETQAGKQDTHSHRHEHTHIQYIDGHTSSISWAL